MILMRLKSTIIRLRFRSADPLIQRLPCAVDLDEPFRRQIDETVGFLTEGPIIPQSDHLNLLAAVATGIQSGQKVFSAQQGDSLSAIRQRRLDDLCQELQFSQG